MKHQIFICKRSTAARDVGCLNFLVQMLLSTADLIVRFPRSVLIESPVTLGTVSQEYQRTGIS